MIVEKLYILSVKYPVVNKLSYSIFRKKIMHGTLNKNLNLKIKPGLVYLKPNLFILTWKVIKKSPIRFDQSLHNVIDP